MKKLIAVAVLFIRCTSGSGQDSLRYEYIDSITSDIVTNKNIVMMKLDCNLTVLYHSDRSCYDVYIDTVHKELRQVITYVKDKMTVYVFEKRVLIEAQLITDAEPDITYTYYYFNNNLIGKSRYNRNDASITKVNYRQKEGHKFVNSSKELIKKFSSNSP